MKTSVQRFKARPAFGLDWSFDEFKRHNLSIGIQVTKADYEHCKRGIKKQTSPPKTLEYSKAHGKLVDSTQKRGITHWSTTPPRQY